MHSLSLGTRWQRIAIPLAIFLLVALISYAVRGEDIPGPVLEALGKIRLIELHGVNVSDYARSLGRLLEKHDLCIASGSTGCLEEVEAELRSLLDTLELEAARSAKAYTARVVIRAVIGALLASAPLVTYVFLPRVIGLLWFKSRRAWLVVRRGGGR